MERRTPYAHAARDRLLLAGIGVLLAAATVLLAWTESQRDWRWYQAEFRSRVAAKLGPEKAAGIPAGLQQIWVPALRRADRCVTCHQAVGWKGFEDAEEPFRTHPQEILRTHPVEKYGCTSCHGGEGYAIDAEVAHGPTPHWDDPVLGRTLGDAYSIQGDRGALLQMNCNTCHRYDRETPGAPAINLAKRLVREKGCRACHVVNGRGGQIGPDLTDVGGKAPEQYDYSRLLGQRSAFAWHVAHLKEPRAITPDTVMPTFGFTTEEAQALAMLVVSWRRASIPADYLPGVARTDPQTPEEVAEEQRMKTGPGAWFVSTGCYMCHNVSSLGVKSPTQIGPDLAQAVEDVEHRFGRKLEDFLREPTGTMSVVLSRQIVLTPAQKAIAAQKLHEAYGEYQRQHPPQVAPSAAPAPATHPERKKKP